MAYEPEGFLPDFLKNATPATGVDAYYILRHPELAAIEAEGGLAENLLFHAARTELLAFGVVPGTAYSVSYHPGMERPWRATESSAERVAQGWHGTLAEAVQALDRAERRTIAEVGPANLMRLAS